MTKTAQTTEHTSVFLKRYTSLSGTTVHHVSNADEHCAFLQREEMMGQAIGIDLGTTNTAVAVMRDGRPRVLEDDKGYNVFPSCVSLADDGSYLIGQTAKSLILTRPERTVYAIKRLIGRRFDAPEVLNAQRRVSYLIEEASNGTCQVALDKQRLSPIEVSAQILAEVKRAAEASLGEAVDQAVITVPAYFNNNQREATIEAARLAGLRCERLLNEPTAAALAYGFRRDYDRTILVFDLGGGTFDVSILQLAGGVYETLSTRGDTYLGGEDFDYRIVDHLADSFQNQFGTDLREDIVALQRLKHAAEQAKCELSFTDKTAIMIPRVTATRNLELQLTRVVLEELVEDLVQRTLDVTRRAVSDAGLQFSDIDDVVLVGGQTRMPRVREAITAMFQKEPSRGVHPEEVVAIGAAVHASALVEDDADSPILLDVTPFDLGIDLVGGLFQPIITRNTHVPISATQQFVTARENQDCVRVVIRQGEGKFAAENEFLGEFLMENLTPGENLRTQVEVSFRLDSNGMLHVSATEPSTGERKKITVRNYAEFAAQNGGAVKPDVEGGGRTESPSTASINPKLAEALGGGEVEPVAAVETPQKRGFFSNFFRRRKETPAPAPAVPTPAEPEAESEDSDVPSIQIPENAQPIFSAEPAAVAELEEEDIDVNEAPEPAQLGMADASASLGAADLQGLDDDEAEAEVQDIQLIGATPVPLESEVVQDIQLVGDTSSLVAFDASGSSEEPAALDDALLEMDSDALEALQPLDEDLSPPGFVDLNADEVLSMDADVDPFALGDDSDADDEIFGEIAEDDFSEVDLDLGDLGLTEDGSDTSANPQDDLDPFTSPPASEAPDSGGDDFLDLGELDIALGDDPEEQPADDSFADLGDFDEIEFDLSALGEPFEETPEPAPAPERAAPEPDTAVSEEAAAPVDVAPEEPAPEPEAAAEPEVDWAAELDVLDDLGLGELASLFEEEPPPRPSLPETIEPPAPAAVDTAKSRKPAKLTMAYKDLESLVSDFQENLAQGGNIIKTPRPLKVGRNCIITVEAPGLEAPLQLSGVVIWISDGQDGKHTEPCMQIEYRFEEGEREALENLLTCLVP